MSIEQLCEHRNAQILVVDIQGKLFPHIAQREHLLLRAGQLLEAAALFNIPVTIVEQYPQGLGKTHPDILKAANNAVTFNKTTFSALATPAISEHLKRLQQPDLIILGTESHVCVLQTAIDALDRGFNVLLAWDACGSRFEEDKSLAFHRLKDAGCKMLSTEMFLFEWMRDKNHPNFSHIIESLRDTK